MIAGMFTTPVSLTAQVRASAVGFGMFKVDAIHVGAAFGGAKPRWAAHWPCRLPATKSGPKVCVGGGEFPLHSRLPPTETRLISEAALALLPRISTKPWTSPR